MWKSPEQSLCSCLFSNEEKKFTGKAPVPFKSHYETGFRLVEASGEVTNRCELGAVLPLASPWSLRRECSSSPRCPASPGRALQETNPQGDRVPTAAPGAFLLCRQDCNCPWQPSHIPPGSQSQGAGGQSRDRMSLEDRGSVSWE